MSSVRARVEGVLSSFLEDNSPDVRGVALVNKRGLPIAASLQAEVDLRMLSAQLAAITSAQDRVASQLGLGEVEIATIEATEGNLLVKLIDEFIVGVLVRKEANIGLVLIGLDSLTKRLREILRE